MAVKQISVFVENKPGRLAEICSVLGDKGVNIRAMSIADTRDFGIFRLIVNDFDKALEVLREKRFTVTVTSVMVIKISDEAGTLGKVLKLIGDARINVEYMYAASFNRNDGETYVIIRTETPERAEQVFSENKIEVVSDEDSREI